MRAAVLAAYDTPLALEDVPEPVCPPDGVVLEVLACGVCRSDWHGWKGEHPRVKPGSIGGHEFCGTVLEAGPDAQWRPGDRVIAPFLLGCGRCPTCRTGQGHVCDDLVFPGLGSIPGGFAERVAVPRAHNLVALPEGLSPVTAAALGCRAMTAWHGLTDRAALRAGEWLAIHGTGGVGLACLILARAMGARIVAVDIVPEKLALARRLGAEAVVDARDGRPAEAVREATGGGAHVSVEALGIAETLNASLQCLRPLGRHVQLGLPVGHTRWLEVDMLAVFAGNLALYGSRGMPATRYDGLLSLILSGRVDFSPLVGREIALSEVSRELAAFDRPAPPGVAVVTDMAA
jgi:alcohol dehydrogenase